MSAAFPTPRERRATPESSARSRRSLPGETVLILAAVYTGAARLNMALVALLASESGA